MHHQNKKGMKKGICILLFLSSIVCAQSTVSEALVPFKKNNSWGFINTTGEVKIDPSFDFVDNFDSSGLCVVQVNHKLGIINSSGNFVLSANYDLAKIIDSVTVMVKDSGKWQLRDLNNKYIVKDIGGNIKTFANGYFVFEKISGWGFGHIARGKLSEAIYTDIKILDTNNIKIELPDGFGICNSMGEIILNCEFEDIEIFENGLSAKRNGLWAFFDLNGEALCEFQFKTITKINEEIFICQSADSKKLFSLSTKSVIISDIESAKLLENKYILVSTALLRGLIDFKGNVLIPKIYTDILPFSDNIFRVVSAVNLKYGLLEIFNDKKILDTEYDYIGPLQGSIGRISKNAKHGALNKYGKITLDIINNYFEIDDNTIKTKQDDNLAIKIFDENGIFKEEAEFRNFKTIKINADEKKVKAFSPREKPEINDSLVWRIGQNFKYGIYNIKTDEYVLTPAYSRFINFPELNICIAEIMSSEIGGKLSLNSANPSINSVWVIINNTIGRPISKPEFIHIEMDDFLTDSLPAARCIFIGGKHGLVNQRGKVLLSGMTYIGKFSEGKALATKTGTLGMDIKGKRKLNLLSAREFFNRLICVYYFGVFGDEYLSKGQMYCDDANFGYIGTDGKWIIDGNISKFEYATDFSNGLAMARKNKKWGLVNATGQEVLPFIYDELNFIPNSDKKLHYISQNNEKSGFIDSDAKLVVPIIYDRVRAFSDGMLAVKKGSYWGFSNEEGIETIPCKYRISKDFSEGFAGITEKGKWGFIDKNVQTVIAPIYLKTGNFSGGLAWVKEKNGNVVFIDKNGKPIISNKFRSAGDFNQGIAKVFMGDKGWGIIDSIGNWILKPKKQLLKIFDFNEYGLAKVKIDKKGYAVINRKGEFITKGYYNEIKDFSESYAVVRRNGYSDRGANLNTDYSLIDINGNELLKDGYSELGPVKNGRSVFYSKEGKYGYISPNSDIVIKPQFSAADNFNDGKAIVFKKYNQTGIIDTLGNFTLEVNINKIMKFSDELALVKSAYASYFFLSEDLQRERSTTYTAVKEFYNGVVPVSFLGNWAIINTKGFKLTSAKFNDIENFQNGYAKVKISSKKGVADVNGKIVIEPEFEFIDYAGNGLFRVEKTNAIGYLNVNGNWVWEMKD